MSILDRRKRQKLALREEILNVARELLKEEGYGAVTIRRIAEQVEYSPMALYNHFPDKSSILVALAEETFQQLTQVLPKAGSGDPVRTLKKGLSTYVRFGLEHADEYRLVFMTRSPEGGPASSLQGNRRETAGGQAFSRLVAYVQTCIESGFIDDDAVRVSMVLWAGIHGVIALLLTNRQGPFSEPKDFTESMVHVLLNGVLQKGR